MNAAELSPHCRRRSVLDGYKEGDFPVKREPDEDFKCYAETTMNEILGWYGFEKVDSRDTQGLNLTHFASNNSSAAGNNSSNGVSPPSSAMEGSDASEDVPSHPGGLDESSRLRSDSMSPNPDASSTASDEVARQHQQMVSALSNITKHPGAPDSPNLPPGYIVCAWCQKVGVKLFTLKTPNGSKAFCSELCFTQCRRASFKKNKICDWCKHVRHTVNYVDFQDGEQQLQFCSDKCLNQYKMNIFCKETQAHLQMHTHLKEAACKLAAAGSVNLITPDLWLRDCKTNGNSRSPHEAIDIMEDVNSDENISIVASPAPLIESPKPSSSPVIEKKESKDHKQDQPLPVKEKDKSLRKHSSKHSSKKLSSENKSHTQKHSREKKNTSHSIDFPLNQRQSPIQASPPTQIRNGQMVDSSHPLLSPPPVGSIPRHPPHMGSLASRHCPPVPSPINSNNFTDHGRQPFLHPNVVPPPFQFFAQQQMEAMLRSQHGLDLRSKLPPHLPIPPWLMPPFPQMHPPPPPPPPHHPPTANSRSPSVLHSSPPSKNSHQISHQKSSHHNKHKHHKHSSINPNNSSQNKPSPVAADTPLSQSSLLPPVTVMVPFPLMLPVPLPIPIPIPIPPQVMDKYSMLKLQQQRKDQCLALASKCDEIFVSGTHQKRKHSVDPPKHRKKQRSLSNDLQNSNKSGEQNAAEIVSENHLSGKCYDGVENLSLKHSQNKLAAINNSTKSSRHDYDVESRSYSPLSDAVSSNDEDGQEKLLKNGDACSGLSFSNYNLNLMRSSPLISQMAEQPTQTLDPRKSPSPTNLSMKDKHNYVSSNVVNYKKKHLSDHSNLIT
ncbi:sine oculis-binding protein homolog isoform X1 [Parasteatoda tepidariorum]|uniref:sine oculis-binding protein homolog isoform X1 n=1 Tax=Parasteatoda tepidariorum TaxID=114398 RepID=UPI001C71CCB6|nr:sine oculis-binding protein homolog isoform X1 [Parasteatoda tepidariorum]